MTKIAFAKLYFNFNRFTCRVLSYRVSRVHRSHLGNAIEVTAHVTRNPCVNPCNALSLTSLITLYFHRISPYNINAIRRITFRRRGAYTMRAPRARRLSSSRRILRVWAPNSWGTSARTITISRGATRKAIGPPPSWISLARTYTRFLPLDRRQFTTIIVVGSTHTSGTTSRVERLRGSHHARLVWLTHPQCVRLFCHACGRHACVHIIHRPRIRRLT